VGGDKLFVDYAGDTVPVIVDRLTGKEREAQIFVAVMGASNFRLTRRIAREPLLARLQEFFGPTVIQVLINAFLAA
jgi:transposase